MPNNNDDEIVKELAKQLTPDVLQNLEHILSVIVVAKVNQANSRLGWILFVTISIAVIAVFVNL